MVVVNSSEIPVKDDKDFTLEFWFRTDASTKADAALVNNGKADGNERGEKGNKFFVGFENSQLIFRSNGYKEVINGSYMDQNWHHFAVSVNRSSGNAQIFMDGELKNYFRSDSVGAISGTEIYLGGCRWGDAQIPDMTYRDRFFSGQIDEFRMWNSALPQSIISRNTNKKMEGSEMGLIAYYPFEKYIVNTANVKELVYTLEYNTPQLISMEQGYSYILQDTDVLQYITFSENGVEKFSVDSGEFSVNLTNSYTGINGVVIIKADGTLLNTPAGEFLEENHTYSVTYKHD